MQATAKDDRGPARLHLQGKGHVRLPEGTTNTALSSSLISAYGYFAVLLLLQSICQRQLPQVPRGTETSGEDQPDEGWFFIDSLIAKK